MSASQRGPECLAKMKILNPKVSGGAWDSGFLASSQVTPRMSVQGPYFEQQDLSALSLALTYQHFYSSSDILNNSSKYALCVNQVPVDLISFTPNYNSIAQGHQEGKYCPKSHSL